jgi:hypothetical protein
MIDRKFRFRLLNKQRAMKTYAFGETTWNRLDEVVGISSKLFTKSPKPLFVEAQL